MASLLGDMDGLAAKPSIKSRKRKPDPEPDFEDTYSSPTRPGASSYRKSNTGAYRGTYADADTSSDGLPDDGFGVPSSDDLMLSPKKKMKTETIDMTPAVKKMGRMEVHSAPEDFDTSFDDVDMDAFLSVDEDEINGTDVKPAVSAKTEVDAKPLKSIDSKLNAQEKKSKLDGVPSWLSVYDSLSVATDDSLGPSSGGARASANSADLSILEEDGSLRFFWLDYLEHEGRLYFVGKTLDKASKSWVSCCVTVENLQRNVFVLPRERRVEEDEETGDLYETDVVPEMKDVFDDFDRVRKRVGIKSWKAKPVKRKYAFGEKDVPKDETQWLKVVYGFDGRRRVMVHCAKQG